MQKVISRRIVSLIALVAFALALSGALLAFSPAAPTQAFAQDDASQSQAQAAKVLKAGVANNNATDNAAAVSAHYVPTTADAQALPDRDTLLARYAERELANALPRTHTHTLEAQSLPASNNLTAEEKTLLAELKKLVGKVASGARTSSLFDIDVVELGIGSIASSYNIDWNAVNRVLDALTIACPYELYWFDRTTGIDYMFSGGLLTISMAVAPEYQDSGLYTVSDEQSSRIQTARSKAKAIVKKNADKSTPERLSAYKTAICKLVSYNDDAAAGYVEEGDPWQIINVFDGDPSTNVVCEGYSKAFAYLCDLSDFADANCYIVEGYMETNWKSEGHMWNVVRMDDGKNYLVDVTNCDTNTIGAPDLLFLANCSEGSVSEGYTFTSGGIYAAYTYNDETIALLGKANLVISKTPYVNLPKTSIADARVKVFGSYVYNGQSQAPAIDDVYVTLDGMALTPSADFSISFRNAKGKAVAASKLKAADTYTVVVKGKGSYKDTATGKFTVKKAANPIVFKRTTKTVSYANIVERTQKVKPLVVSKAKGTVTYKKVSGSNRLTVNKTTGKVTVKKDTEPGIYKIKVQVKAAGTANHKAKTKSLVLKVRVK